MTPLQLLYVVAALILGPVVFLKLYRKSLQSPGRKETDILLLKSPNKFDSLDIIYLILSLLAKYILSTIGLCSSLTPSRSENLQFSLPSIRLSGLLKVDDADIARFNAAIKANPSPSSDRAALNPLFLSALTGPLVIYLLALPACPIKPLGAVNTRNKMTLLPTSAKSATLLALDPTNLLKASKADRLSYQVSFGGRDAAGKRTKRGVEFTVRIEIFHESVELPSSGKQLVMLQELTYLQFLSRETIPHYSAIPTHLEDTGPATEDLDRLLQVENSQQTLKIAARDPWRWAACNKDYNPIHISGVAAKLFGQSGVVAHGMHVVAMALEVTAVQDQRSENALGISKSSPVLVWRSLGEGFTVEMKFLKPIRLPASLQLRGQTFQHGKQSQIVAVGNEKALTWIRCSKLER